MRTRFIAHKRRPTAAILHPPTPREATMEVPPALSPIVVDYNNGLLAVTAQDAALGDILESLHASTGALVDSPALQEHVSVQLMPRTPVQVIASLLEGMQLNYVIVGGTSEQDRLQHLIVRRRPKAVEPPAAVVQEDLTADARLREAARFAEETGGDEGVWENEPKSLSQTGAVVAPRP
ncbi:MAG: hypothetical protein WA172_19855 [Terriglobales bacterium]